MKVIESHFDGSKIILNPHHLSRILEHAPHPSACGVLTPSDLIISTVPMSSHTDTAEAAGVDIRDIFHDSKQKFSIGKKDLRLQMCATGLDVELWFFDYWSNAENFDYDDLPISKEQMDELASWIKSHPKIRLAYGKVEPNVTLTIRDDADPLWLWESGNLTKQTSPSYGV